VPSLSYAKNLSTKGIYCSCSFCSSKYQGASYKDTCVAGVYASSSYSHTHASSSYAHAHASSSYARTHASSSYAYTHASTHWASSQQIQNFRPRKKLGVAAPPDAPGLRPRFRLSNPRHYCLPLFMSHCHLTVLPFVLRKLSKVSALVHFLYKATRGYF